MTDSPIKNRPVGRPKKVLYEPQAKKSEPAPKYKMKAKPNWEDLDPSLEDSPDRLRIDPSLIPDGMSAQWVTSTVFGQPVPQHRSEFEKKGWTPVHQEDFDGRFDGMFMPKGATGEITVDGLVLMMRPKEITDQSKLNDRRRAMEQVFIKEQALRGGELNVTLDSRHPSAVASNRVSKSIERLDIPKE